MKEATELKIVVGANMPRPRGLNGAIGWTESTVIPYRKSSVLKTSIETAYCFQFWGPELTRSSNHRRTRGGWYLPSITHAIYRLSGIESTTTVARTNAGSNHMDQGLLHPRCPELEPLRADERCEEVDKEKRTDDGGQVDHVA